MLERVETQFSGYECIKLENESLTLWVTTSIGPRIIGLALKGADCLFAILPNETVEFPGGEVFYFRGGHRLWHAPEDHYRTYIPDNEPVTVLEVENGIQVIQSMETLTGVQKSLRITLPDQDARVIVEHSLQNFSRSPIELAPWAITQLKTGGLAILPQATGLADEYGLFPNRHIVLWPYTKLNSPYIAWGDHFIFIDAKMQDGALKIGFPNPDGWMGYYLNGTLFIKRADYQPGKSYFDRGSSSECYCNPRFLELETLGPRTTIAPKETVTHWETWEIHPQVDFKPTEETARKIVEALGL
jgi:hypothetical protein